MPSFRVVGPGRAGGSLVAALTAAGWESAGLLGRADDPTAAAVGVDLLVLATPDAAIGEVAARVDPSMPERWWPPEDAGRGIPCTSSARLSTRSVNRWRWAPMRYCSTT